MPRHATSPEGRGDGWKSTGGRPERPRVRLAHALFVVWVAGSIAWLLFAAGLAHDRGWWMQRPLSAALLVLIPPVIAHLLSTMVIRISGNPILRS